MNRGDVRPAPDLRPIAADLLGIDPETPAGVVQASLLRRLADHGFAPDPMTVDAVRVLSGQRVAPFGDLESALRISCEEQRSAEVEAFAAEFFDVPVASRLDRFSGLETACRGHLRLLSRLSGLRPGLTVARPAADAGSPEVRRLVAHVLELFVMPPGPRAARSRELAAAWRNDPNLRNATRFGARKRFRAQHPAIAALDPPFLGRLDPPARPRLPSRARARVSKILGTRITGGLGSGGGNYTFPIIIIVVVNLLRLAGRSGGNQTPAPTYNVPTSTPPGVSTRVIAGRTRFETNQLRQIQAQALLPRLKTGLAEFGHRPDDGTLKRVIEAIPRQTLDWILFARFDSELEFRAAEDALRAALISAGIVLKPEDSDTLANACFRPKTAASGFPTNVRLPAFPSTDGP